MSDADVGTCGVRELGGRRDVVLCVRWRGGAAAGRAGASERTADRSACHARGPTQSLDATADAWPTRPRQSRQQLLL